jgi:hypothetical protein
MGIEASRKPIFEANSHDKAHCAHVSGHHNNKEGIEGIRQVYTLKDQSVHSIFMYLAGGFFLLIMPMLSMLANGEWWGWPMVGVFMNTCPNSMYTTRIITHHLV